MGHQSHKGIAERALPASEVVVKNKSEFIVFDI